MAPELFFPLCLVLIWLIGGFWYTFQAAIILGVFYWLGTVTDFHDHQNVRTAGIAGGVVALVVTYALCCIIDYWRAAMERLKRPKSARGLGPKFGPKLRQTARHSLTQDVL